MRQLNTNEWKTINRQTTSPVEPAKVPGLQSVQAEAPAVNKHDQCHVYVHITNTKANSVAERRREGGGSSEDQILDPSCHLIP